MMERRRWWVIGLGAFQGLCLWYVHELYSHHTVIGNWFTVWLVSITLSFIIPIFIQLTVQNWGDTRLWIFVGATGVLLGLLSFYCSTTIYAKYRSFDILFPFAISIVLASLIAVCFTQAWLEHRRYDVPFETLFYKFWENGLTLAIGILSVLIVIFLEYIWENLFRAIDLNKVAGIFERKNITYPFNGLVFGYALYFGRAQHGAIRALRNVCLAIFRGLFLVLAVMVIAFCAALAYTGIHPLLEHKSALTWILIVQLAAIVFVNAVYQDGNTTTPYRRIVRGLITAALVLIAMFSVLSGYLLILRIEQHGWSLNRIWAALIAIVFGGYVIAYAVTALARSEHWLKGVGRINIFMAQAVFLLAVLINTPILDGKEISVWSQMDRLLHARTDPDQFDYEYLSRMGKPGYYGLLDLAYLQNRPQADRIRKGALAVFDDLGCSERIIASTGKPRPVLRGHGQLYFVPLGGLPISIDRLTDYFNHKYKMSIEILPRIEPGSSEWNSNRHQYVAENLGALIRQKYPELSADPNALVIGIIQSDMYIKAMTWRYAFSWRNENRLAVVSSARFDPFFFGEPENNELLFERLRKMIAKDIGVMHYGLGPTADRRSVMCSPILSLEDLDSMSEEY
jgi:predicted Zn-dependent protease